MLFRAEADLQSCLGLGEDKSCIYYLGLAFEKTIGRPKLYMFFVLVISKYIVCFTSI